MGYFVFMDLWFSLYCSVMMTGVGVEGVDEFIVENLIYFFGDKEGFLEIVMLSRNL